MIRTVVLLGLFAACAFSANKPWNAGLSYKFDINPFTWKSSSFVNLPRSSTDAKEKGWTVATRPTTSYSSGYDALVLWVNPDKVVVGILVDECGQTSGLQINIPTVGLNSYYDMTKQGFTPWTYTNATGDTTDYWAISQYFVSPDKETRIASCNETVLLREDYMVVEGINGELLEIATTLDDIDSIWTKQACVPLMGLHYYYNMTTTLSCDEPFHPYFPLYDDRTKQMIGIGLMLIGSHTSSKDLETPSKAAVGFIVPTCPECLLDLVDSVHALTMHFYFVDNPLIIVC